MAKTKQYNTVAELIQGVNDGATNVFLFLPDNIKNDPIANLAEIKLLADFLKTNTSLQSLNLRYNNIGDAGGTSIGEALKTNTSLQSLGLRYNNIGAAGGASIGEALKTNTSLQSLGLQGNGIGNETLQAVKKTIDNNIRLNQPENIAYQGGVAAGIFKEVAAQVLDRSNPLNIFPDEVVGHIASFAKVELHRAATVCKNADATGNSWKEKVLLKPFEQSQRQIGL